MNSRVCKLVSLSQCPPQGPLLPSNCFLSLHSESQSFFTWFLSPRLTCFHKASAELFHCPERPYLSIPHSGCHSLVLTLPLFLSDLLSCSGRPDLKLSIPLPFSLPLPVPLSVSWISSTMSLSCGPSCRNTRRPSQRSVGHRTTLTSSPRPQLITCSLSGTWPSRRP